MREKIERGLSYRSEPTKPSGNDFRPVQSIFEGASRGFFSALRPGSFIPFIIGSLLLFAVAASAGPPSGGPGPAPMVTVATVQEMDVNPPAEYVGRVEAIQAVDLRARVEGVLEKVEFGEGGDVSSGDLLYVIERAPYEADVNEKKAAVAEAEANLTKARQYLERLQAVRSGGVSEADLETAVSSELQAKAKLEKANATLARSELDLGYTTIKAPVTGRIGRTEYTRGNLVGPGSGSLARIVQLDPIRVVYSVSDNYLLDMRIAKNGKGGSKGGNGDCDLTPRIRMSNQALYPHEGRVDFVDNRVDPGTGTVAVRAVFDNPDGILLPGQYVNVMVECKEGRKLPAVPQSAVQEDREGKYVFVVDKEGAVRQRRIETGAALGTRWAVEKGLAAGEVVIVQGVQKVKPGQAVETVTEMETEAAPERG